MTYVSHTVRSLRRDPIPGETVRLVLEVGDEEPVSDSSSSSPSESADSAGDSTASASDSTASTSDSTASATESVAEAVESLGGEVVRELEFDRLLVAVEQTQLDEVCELAGVTTVETDAVLNHSG